MTKGNQKEFPKDVYVVYGPLNNAMCQLHLVWLEYRALFAKDEATIDVFNECAPAFAGLLQREMQDSTYLGLTRINDPAKSGGFENMTIRRLEAAVSPYLDKPSREELNRLIKAAELSCSAFREHRNKRIGHSDFSFAMKATYSRPSRSEVEKALKACRDVMNYVCRHFTKGIVAYEHLIIHSGADALVYSMKNAVKFEHIRESVERGGLNGDALRQAILGYQ